MAYLAQGIMTLNHRFAKGMLGDDE